MSTTDGLNPPTPYTGTNPTLGTINYLETEVDLLLPAIMSGGVLVGSGSPFMPGDSIGSFQANSAAGSAAVALILMMLTEIAMLEEESGNSQALWNPFTPATSSTFGDTLVMPPGWSGSSAGGYDYGGNGGNGGGGTGGAGGGGTGGTGGTGGAKPAGAGGAKDVTHPASSAAPPVGSTAPPVSSSAPPIGSAGGPISSIGYAGDGTDQTYNVVNNTSQGEYFTYTDTQGGSCTIYLASGQSGRIYAAASATGDRITPDGSSYNPGDPNGNEELFENGAGQNGTQWTDISEVDGVEKGVGGINGGIDGSGNKISMLAILPNGETVGDGGNFKHSYQYPYDDAASLANGPGGPITLVVSDQG